LSRPARFSRRARREIAKALAEFEHVAAKRRLRSQLETAALQIGRHPAIGRHELALAAARYRFWSVPGFPFLLVYLPDSAPPSIVRFVHTKRDLPRVLAELRDAPDEESGEG
jgi:toxin ParE1/3/4